MRWQRLAAALASAQWRGAAGLPSTDATDATHETCVSRNPCYARVSGPGSKPRPPDRRAPKVAAKSIAKKPRAFSAYSIAPTIRIPRRNGGPTVAFQPRDKVQGRGL